MIKPIIGTGFYATSGDSARRGLFMQEVWLPALESIGVERGDIVVVDNAEDHFWPAGVRHVPISHNLGHVGGHLGQDRPHLLGWSMSWVIPATIAHSEQRDFVYVEQDCLLFGDCIGEIQREAARYGWKACFGRQHSKAECEQSLFWVSADYITEFIWRYLAIPHGDGVMLPEAKFRRMMRDDPRIGMFSLGVGRERPLTFDAPAWYAQQLSTDELAELKSRKLI